jgi:hypothetical protein
MIKLLRMSCFAAVDNLDLEKGQRNENFSRSLHFVLIKRLNSAAPEQTYLEFARVFLIQNQVSPHSRNSEERRGYTKE